MLKRMLSAALLGLLLFSLFYNSVVWVKYELNVEEITELFCINKDRPELQCFGKCYAEGELIDFNLLPEAPEAPVGEATYVPVLKHFMANRLAAFKFSKPEANNARPASFCYCFWESHTPEPFLTPPRAIV